MRKPLAAILIVMIICSVSASINCASAEKTVSGLITSDTTWSRDTTYRLTGPVGIVKGVTLTVEPGVSVDVGSYYIQVNGTLNVQGTSNNKVTFTCPGFSGSDLGVSGPVKVIQFMESSTAWNEPALSGCIIQNAVLKSVRLSINNCSPKISSNTFNFSRIMATGGSPLIINNNIYCEYGPAISATGTAKIENNYLCGNGFQYGIDAGESVYLYNNVLDLFKFSVILRGNAVFSHNTINNGSTFGISSESNTVTINNNYLTSCAVAITGFGNIENNTIVGNGIGTKTSNAIIKNNNIYGNTEKNLVLTDSSPLDVSGNYWGTTNSETIGHSIKDSKDDFSLGTATYTPFLSQPNAAAPISPLTIDNLSSDWTLTLDSGQVQSSILEVAELVAVSLVVGWLIVLLAFLIKKRKPANY